MNAAKSVVLVAFAIMISGCNLLNDLGSTSPSSSSSSSTETFANTLSVQGASAYSFTVAKAGTVSVDLTTVSPVAVSVGLGIGTPSGTTCTLASSVGSAVAGSSAQLTVTENPGSYCVEIYDVGNLTAPETFSVTITHS